MEVLDGRKDLQDEMGLIAQALEPQPKHLSCRHAHRPRFHSYCAATQRPVLTMFPGDEREEVADMGNERAHAENLLPLAFRHRTLLREAIS